MNFEVKENYSLVTAILPRRSTERVIDEVMSAGVNHCFTQSARGSVLKDRWYQSFLPSLSPEQEIIRFLAPNEDTGHLMEQIVMVGKLRQYGAGSIFSMECLDVTTAGDFPLWAPGQYTFESVSFDIRFREDLNALIHVLERDTAEGITRAAINAGAAGPTISYIRGFGLRDRLGLLRITKKHDKEQVTVVVDNYDLDAVFQAMAESGHVDQPGRGILCQVPLSKGLVNLASVFQAKKHSASIQQIVRAIDDLHGTTDWRANQLLIHDPKAAEFAKSSRGSFADLRSFNLLCRRKDVDPLLYAALDLGIPGASVSNLRGIQHDNEATTGGLRLNREFGCVTVMLAPERIPELQKMWQEMISEREMKETCFFSHKIAALRTFASSTIAEKN